MSRKTFWWTCACSALLSGCMVMNADAVTAGTGTAATILWEGSANHTARGLFGFSIATQWFYGTALLALTTAAAFIILRSADIEEETAEDYAIIDIIEGKDDVEERR